MLYPLLSHFFTPFPSGLPARETYLEEATLSYQFLNSVQDLVKGQQTPSKTGLCSEDAAGMWSQALPVNTQTTF